MALKFRLNPVTGMWDNYRTETTAGTKTELPKSKDTDKMTIFELKEYAADNGIDVKGLRAKADLLQAIEKAEGGILT